MDKQKQIEEVVKYLRECSNHAWAKGFDYAEVDNEKLRVFLDLFPEDAVVLTREEYEELKKGVQTHNYTAVFNAMEADRWLDGYKQGFKEGVQAVQIQLKERLHYDVIYESGITNERDVFECIDEICKELEGENGKT